MQRLHPLHALLLAGAVPLFLSALLNDVAYWASFQTQWKNFASWSIVAGLLLGGLALAWTLGGALRPERRGPRWLLCTGLLFAAWSLGLVNALVHAGDAWASMPLGLVLSAIVVALALAAAWIGLSGPARVTAS